MSRSLLLVLAVAAASVLPAVAGAGDFETYHPDQRNRRLGLDALERGDHEWAARFLRKAAHYADKGAQALVAELYWDGSGVPQDRALAYAWMDLAAERGYPPFAVKRERYWTALTPAERERALEVGRRVYAEYGDTVAKPRLEQKLEQGRRRATGSRIGASVGVRVYTVGPDGSLWWDPEYYADRHWKPREYWKAQDAMYRRPPRGVVEVGPLVEDPADPPSR